MSWIAFHRPITTRIRQLAERYDTPLPQLVGEVTDLSARVDEHLQTNGGGMELKPGYKQTEVGGIPEDWEFKNSAPSRPSLMGCADRSKAPTERE